MKLRRIEYSDNKKIVEWRNKDFVLEHFIDRNLLTVEKHNVWFTNMVMSGKVHQFIIIDDDGKEIGSTFLKNVDYNNLKAELGIFIGEESGYGHGYGKEATRMTCDYAFNVLKLHKVYLRVISDNIRAVKCYEKVGFVKEGEFKDDVYDGNSFVNVSFMAVINSYYNTGGTE